MLYLLDANILITANRTYYPIDRVPEFWAWLLHQAKNKQVKIPNEIRNEIKPGSKPDPLTEWIAKSEHEKVLLLDEKVDQHLLLKVQNEGYGVDLTDIELEMIGRDQFLIAYAMAQPDRCIVTNEVSKLTQKRQNRKIPDVCNLFKIKYCTPFEFNKDLNFHTSWDREAK